MREGSILNTFTLKWYTPLWYLATFTEGQETSQENSRILWQPKVHDRVPWVCHLSLS
jgi:hypothetical protein